jgi:hypothetical protein
MYGTIAKVAVPGDTAGFLLILGINRIAIDLTSSAVMSSVSQFIGFLVIFIFPRTDHPKDPTLQPLYRTKSGESLVPRSDEEAASDEDVVSIPSTSRSTAVNNNDPVSRAKLSEPRQGSALSTPEFWMIAFIMSMCRSSLIATSNQPF